MRSSAKADPHVTSTKFPQPAVDRTWNERHAEQTEEMARTIDQIREEEQYRTQKGRERNFDAREQAVALAESEAAMRSRGEALVNDRYQQLLNEKRSYEVREQQLVNISEENRQRTKEELDNIPRDQPRDFSDYNRNKLAMEYPPGVTEESYTEGNKVIIRRVVVNGNKADVVEEIRALTGTGCHYAVETTGVPPVVRQSLNALRPLGTTAIVGVTPKMELDIHNDLMAEGKSMIGVIEGDSVPRVFIPKLVEYYKAGLFPFDRLVKFYAFDQISQAFEDSANGSTVKPVLRLDSSHS